jgi:inosine/xanthosine triphosphatase
VFAPRQCVVSGFDVASGVDAQPKSAEETIQGAENRARAALQTAGSEFDFGVGLEGGIEQVGTQWFECGWFFVIDRAGKTGVGSSARFRVGESVVKKLFAGQELADVVKEFTQNDVRAGLGMMGVLTNGHLPRDECYSQGLIFAFGPWLSEDHWGN